MIRTSGIINSSVSNTKFDVYSSKEIEKLSVVKITSAKSLDLGGNPIDNGLYDSRFGPLRQEDICVNRCLLVKTKKDQSLVFLTKKDQ